MASVAVDGDGRREQRGFQMFRGRRDVEAVARYLRANGMVGGGSKLLERARHRFWWLRYYAAHRPVDRLFDRRYGTETGGVVDQRRLTVVDDDRAGSQPDGREYEATPVAALRDMFEALPVEPADYTFVDLGSGKGRSVMVAAKIGFRRAVGVEFASELHEVAERNVASFRRREPAGDRIELVNVDAAEYRYPPGPLLIYLYSPFRGRVLKRVAASIEASYAADPRPMLLVHRVDRDSWRREVVQEFDGIEGFRRGPTVPAGRAANGGPVSVVVHEAAT